MAKLNSRKSRHIFKYINWKRDAEYKILENDDFKEFHNTLDEELEIVNGYTVASNYKEGAYHLVKDNCMIYIYTVLNNRYIVFGTNYTDNKKNETAIELNEELGTDKKDKHAGTIAYQAVQEKFKEVNNTSLKKAFDTTEVEIKNCIPKQFYWIDENYKNRVLTHVNGFDFCSHYPSNLCGDLPDAHTAIEVEGRVKPTKEYPFAFYINSRTVAEFGKYDTRDWLKSRYVYSLFTNENLQLAKTVKDEDEITVLMKPSKYKFDDVMEHFYKLRKEDPIAKLVMNAFIGMLHTKKYVNHKYAHLAAIAIARSNEKMRALAEYLQYPIHICVDGCIYKDNYILGETDESKKALNVGFQEFIDCDFKMTGTNMYVVINESGNVIKFKHGSSNARRDGLDINTVCNGFDDINQWYRDTRSVDDILKLF